MAALVAPGPSTLFFFAVDDAALVAALAD